MEQATKDRLSAAAKIARGVGQIGMGVVTATGHGLIGGLLKSSHMIMQAQRLGAHEVEGGLKHLEKGIEAWKKC